MPRLLLILPQLPQDPASGAARSLRTICEMLAAAGWEVRALATTATENATSIAAAEFLRTAGYAVTIRPPNRAVYRHDRAVLEFVGQHAIHYQLLEARDRPDFLGTEKQSGQFNRLFQRALTEFRPDVVFAFGGSAADIERFRRAQAAGCKVVFGLRNLGYLAAPWLRSLDGVLTPSQFLSERYRSALGLASTPLPTPLDLADVIAPEREAIFFTTVNPSREKGAFFLARLAEELALRRPDLPMLFIESRGSAGAIVQVGLAAGFDLRRHESLMFAPAVPRPADFFRGTRVLLVPSVVEEASGRVVAEALVNGVPPIVSGRGGLAESTLGAGFIVPLPDTLTLATNTPVPAANVQPWIDCMERLADDNVYATASARARAAGAAYLPATLAPRYVEFFERALGQSRSGL